MPTIDLPITWTPPGTPKNGTVTVPFTETKTKDGYYTRIVDEKSIVWPVGFPEDQKQDAMKPLYHMVNFERQKVVPDDKAVATDPVKEP